MNFLSINIFLIVLVFLFGFFFNWLLPLFKISLSFLEWDFLSFKFSFYFNSLMFSFILFLVTLSVLVFSTYYLDSELSFNYYYFVLLIFVGSMFFLNFSSSVYTMMLSWDLLGISSFFLVMFYNNWDSVSGSMNTALTNRMGDYFMFIFFSSSLFSGYFFFSLSFFSGLVFLFLLFMSFTKSAQFPFSSWLPKAMSAPTPVSSLVHSSTLVTAGLIMMMNFSNMILQSNLMSIILIFGIFTMFFSSITALVEEDMKKVVALSTLSQMGFSTVTLGLGLSFVSFLHLVSHALFKSCLFMQVGYIIHCSEGQQDSRSYSNNGNISNIIQIQLLLTLFCLCGLIFSSGSVSKDLILEVFYFNNYMFFFSLMFFVSVFFTFMYSYRLWKGFFFNFIKVLNFKSVGFFMTFLSFLLVVFSISFIWWLNLNILSIPVVYLYLDFFSPLMYLLIMVVSFGFFMKSLIYLIFVKFLSKEVVYKFIVDYLNIVLIYFNINIKFLDMLLNKFNISFFSFFLYFNYYFNFYMKFRNYGLVTFLVFLLFIFV